MKQVFPAPTLAPTPAPTPAPTLAPTPAPNLGRNSRAAPAACPCGGSDYRRCCEPLHLGALAATPEALMRSRYSAYVKNLELYLRHSWHPSTCPLEIQLDPDCVWLGLEVKSVSVASDENTGTVEFVARYRIKGGSASRITELSEFMRFQGRWVYLRG